MIERGISVDHSTIYRWVYEYAPDFEKKIRWHQGYRYSSWRVDETYIKVKGKWRYLYRAVDKNGTTIDFFLSHKRDSKSAKRFFKQALRKLKDYERPSIINTDKNPAYNSAIEDLKKEGLLNINTEHRKVKYLNNIVESDHFRLKKAMKVIHGFKTFSSAYRTIKGMEAMLMIKKRQCIIINNTEEHKILEEVNFVNKLFGLYKVEYV
jgi:transposase-like protein